MTWERIRKEDLQLDPDFLWRIPPFVRKGDDKKITSTLFSSVFASEYYNYLYYVVKKIKPNSLLEIGVRAGYSMFSFLSANPRLEYLGIDDDSGTHGGTKGFINHAKDLAKLFPEARVDFMICSSHELDSLPRTYTMSYIDGDHSMEGCFSDLVLAKKWSSYILVDDVDYIPDVRTALEMFLHEEDPLHCYTVVYFPSLRGHVLLVP